MHVSQSGRQQKRHLTLACSSCIALAHALRGAYKKWIGGWETDFWGK